MSVPRTRRHIVPALAAAAMLFAGGAAACAAAPPVDGRMECWRDARFGLFIHWGLYAVPAGKWGDRDTYGEWIMHSAQIPIETYEQFLPQFNPQAFDARRWARMAREAGMGYVVITTKHHDGFCLFDSALTNYDVMSTPFDRDIMAEIATAFREEELGVGWYHSIMDWHHPDYLPRRAWEKRSADGAEFDRYVRYLEGQVRELMTKYGPIDIMWFDGEWERTWSHTYGQRLYDLCRSLRPDVVVNNRVDVGRGGKDGLTTAGYAGDFGTPEQHIPTEGLPGADWETCMTMNGHWGYCAADQNWKSTTDLVQKLCDIVSKGGNFLLNVGPTASGEFPPESIERLAEIGAWMKVNGESIHGTTASLLPAVEWGRSTTKRAGDQTTVYLQVFDWPAGGDLSLGMATVPTSVTLLASPGRRVTADATDAGVVVRLGATAPGEHAHVVALTFESDPVIFRAPEIDATADVFLGETEVMIGPVAPGVELLYTLDGTDPAPGTAHVVAGTVPLTESAEVRAQAWYAGRPVSEVVARTITRVEPRPADAPVSQPGVQMEVFPGDFDEMPSFADLAATESRVTNAIALPAAREHEALRFRGFLTVPAAGVYRFRLTSDDGSMFLIGNDVVIDNDGLHGAHAEDGAIALAAGRHLIDVQYFNKTGSATLELEMARAGEPFAPINAASLSH